MGQVQIQLISSCSAPVGSCRSHHVPAALQQPLSIVAEICLLCGHCLQSVEEDLESAGGQNYQQEFLRCLREVNVDNNTVGWYQSSTLGAYQTQEMIETFISYHDSIKKCVCIVYDPQKSQRGQVSLRAIRLKESFIDLFKEQKLTGTVRIQTTSWLHITLQQHLHCRHVLWCLGLGSGCNPESAASCSVEAVQTA